MARGPLLGREQLDEFAVQRRTIDCRRIDQLPRSKIREECARATDMSRVTVRQD